MDIFPKFIIEDGCLIISKVTYHKQLVTNVADVKGGGWFIMDFENKTLTFYGKSEDFGKAKLVDIQECVKNNKVYTNRSCSRSITDKYKFFYKNEYGDIIPLN